MKLYEYNQLHEELRPYLVDGKRLKETEIKWMEKKGAIRREPSVHRTVKKEREKIINTEGKEEFIEKEVVNESRAYYDIIIDLPLYKTLNARLDEYNRCEFGQQKRFEALTP